MRPRDLEVLAFPKVLDAMAALAVSTAGAQACRALRPAGTRPDAERALDRQWAFFRLLEVSGPLPLAPFPDVREALAIAGHEGAVLGGDRLVDVRTVLQQIERVRSFLRAHLGELAVLGDLPTRLRAFPELETALARMLDDTGVLRDDASPRLAELRATLRELRLDIEERLQRLVTSSGDPEAIADRYVTVRNNRFVVPVRSSAAARVPGVVQDRSASGETLFVEPLFAIDLNNSLLLRRKEEEQEEIRLLALLTAQIGAVRDELAASFVALAEVDRLAAGAAFARRLRGTRPAIEGAHVDLRQARHPELLLSGSAVVPIDVRLEEGKRALVVSGPNTGGKTVALKTLGLLTLLAQSGVLVPAEEGSVLPFVGGVFTDLADDQSIERSLSTFSSHVVNLVEIFHTLRPPALVLLDEPGGGTDPEEGAALAIALIDRLIESGALVAAATHYAPVKLFALNDPRVQLAAVDVDPHTFEPRYRLVYGSVGESLGLAMARRLALPADVLAAAETRRSGAARELASAIGRLEATRRRLEDERAAAVEERRALAEQEHEHARLLAELRERRRARWSADLEESRAFLRGLKEEGRALLDLIRRKPPDAASALAGFVRRADEQITRHAAAVAEPGPSNELPPAIGDEVEVRGTAIRGELIALRGGGARVRRGGMTFEVPAAQLRRAAPGRAGASASGARAATASVVRDGPAVEASAGELNLVGQRVKEALARLERFLDHAQETGSRSVRIVHGLGSGALKRAVAEYLAASDYCTRFHEAEPSEGGPGVTIAELL